MDLAPHLWQLAGLGRVNVVFRFHAPVTLAKLGSRKALSDHRFAVCERLMAAALTGRIVRSAMRADAALA